MRLDSARGLRDELLRDLGPPPGEVDRRTRLGVSARRVAGIAPVQPELALGVAPAGRGGEFRLAVRVQRRDLLGSPRLDAIADAARGEVDVRYVGRVAKLAGGGAGVPPVTRRRHRPLVVGASAGHHEITAGTLGCFVVDRGGAVAILSNNHVLADENRGAAGDAILQPGPADGGRDPRDAVARLGDFVPLRATGVNRLDCAIAPLLDGVELDATGLVIGGGVLDLAGGLVAPEDAKGVEKLGRTTGRTRSRVTAFDVANVTVAYDIADAIRFDGQIEIEGDAGGGPFSLGGDSGSLVFSEGDHRPVGLLFAGSDQGGAGGGGLTFANPIAEVLDALGVALHRGS